MDNAFKINMYFDEKGEGIEKIIEQYLIEKINNENSKIQDILSSMERRKNAWKSERDNIQCSYIH